MFYRLGALSLTRQWLCWLLSCGTPCHVHSFHLGSNSQCSNYRSVHLGLHLYTCTWLDSKSNCSRSFPKSCEAGVPFCWAVILLRIREVLCSNLGSDIDYADWGFFLFFSGPSVMQWDGNSDLATAAPFHKFSASLVSRHSTIRCCRLTASLKEP